MDAFLFNSENTRKTVADLRGSRASFKPSWVCRPPLKKPTASPAPTGQGRLLFLGNLVPRKNLLGLLGALGLVCQQKPELLWSLTVAGNPDADPRYAKRCRRLADAWGLGSRVVWAGRVDETDLEALWSKTDLLAMPSFHEGWGMAHAEALARGIVALAVPSGALPEVLGNAGLWASAPDPASIAKALLGFFENFGVRDDLATKARFRGEALVRHGTGFADLEGFLGALPRRNHSPVSPAPLDFGLYLEAKATIDTRSLHPRVLETVFSGKPPSRILDLGGGTGTMARRLRTLGKVGPDALYELVDLEVASLKTAETLSAGHFALGKFRTHEAEFLAFCEKNAGLGSDLVIAHAILDLFDADTAAPALARLGGKRYWLTHLFDGLTAWEPLIEPELDSMIIAAYHRTMDERAPGRGDGSSRSGRDWLTALPQAGFRILDAGASDWIVRPDRGVYKPDELIFLHAILGFFRTSLTAKTDVDQTALTWWLAVRAAQIQRGEVTFVAHQLDLAVELWEPSHQK